MGNAIAVQQALERIQVWHDSASSSSSSPHNQQVDAVEEASTDLAFVDSWLQSAEPAQSTQLFQDVEPHQVRAWLTILVQCVYGDHAGDRRRDIQESAVSILINVCALDTTDWVVICIDANLLPIVYSLIFELTERTDASERDLAFLVDLENLLINATADARQDDLDADERMEQDAFLARLLGPKTAGGQLVIGDTLAWLRWLADISKNLSDATLHRVLGHAIHFVVADAVASAAEAEAEAAAAAAAIDVHMEQNAVDNEKTALVAPQPVDTASELAFCRILATATKRKGGFPFWTAVLEQHQAPLLGVMSRVIHLERENEDENEDEAAATRLTRSAMLQLIVVLMRDDIASATHRHDLLFLCDSLGASRIVLGQPKLQERVSDIWLRCLLHMAREPANSEQAGASILDRWETSGVLPTLVFLMQPWSEQPAHVNFSLKIWHALLKETACTINNRPEYATRMLECGLIKTLAQHVIHLAQIVDQDKVARARVKQVPAATSHTVTSTTGVMQRFRTNARVEPAFVGIYNLDDGGYMDEDLFAPHIDAQVHNERMLIVFEIMQQFLQGDSGVAHLTRIECGDAALEDALVQLSTSDAPTREVRKAALLVMRRIIVIDPATTKAAAGAVANVQVDDDDGAEHDTPSANEEDNASSSYKMCSICLESKLLSDCMLFLPCAHVACCTICAHQVKLCPKCRAPITQRSKIYV